MKRQAIGGVANGVNNVANARKRGMRVTRNVIFLGDNTQPISFNFLVNTRSNSVSSTADATWHNDNAVCKPLGDTDYVSGHAHGVYHALLLG